MSPWPGIVLIAAILGLLGFTLWLLVVQQRQFRDRERTDEQWWQELFDDRRGP